MKAASSQLISPLVSQQTRNLTNIHPPKLQLTTTCTDYSEGADRTQYVIAIFILVRTGIEANRPQHVPEKLVFSKCDFTCIRLTEMKTLHTDLK